MKRINKIVGIIAMGLVLASCEHDVETDTQLREDGSLDRTITFQKGDDINEEVNHFGIKASEGWELSVEKRKKSNGSNSKTAEYVSLSRSFDNVDQVNELLDTENDSLFRMHSSFHKSFRWFYTYIFYSDTYRKVNRFDQLPIAEILTQEDLAFIDRLPAEGSKISMADSIFLKTLNTKVYEEYTMRAFYEEHISYLEDLVIDFEIGENYLDTIFQYRNWYYDAMKEDTDEFGFSDNDGEFLAIYIADTLNIPLTDEAKHKYINQDWPDLESKMDMMVWANDADFVHTLNVPWELVETNADSVSENNLEWKPPVTKLLFKDYEMYVVVRKLNVWTLVISGLVVLFAIIVLVRRF